MIGDASGEMDGLCCHIRILQQIAGDKIAKTVDNKVFKFPNVDVAADKFSELCQITVWKRLLVNPIE